MLLISMFFMILEMSETELCPDCEFSNNGCVKCETCMYHCRCFN